MENVKVELNNLEFSVSVDGAVTVPQRVNGTLLDEARLQAADSFLAYKVSDFRQGKGLTKAQRDYWAGVRTVTPVEKRGRF
jgi:hypothetical protein